ncbi:unnamed protein product [Withania somnifera]
MDVSPEDPNVKGEGESEEMDREPTSRAYFRDNGYNNSGYSVFVRQKAYIFDGEGNYFNKEWDLTGGRGKEFCWYHVELPKWNRRLTPHNILLMYSRPPMKLQDIFSLMGLLSFELIHTGPASSKFTFRILARFTNNSPINMSLGRVPRLGFSPVNESLLSRFLFWKVQEANNPVPKSLSNLVVHIIDTHVDHLQDVVTKLEIELDAMELEIDKQVIAHGEQVFPRVKEKCSSKGWFASDDINSLEELIGRLRRLKENVGFIANRVTAIQAGLDSWQSEQINKKLYYLSFLSIVFLPLSVVTGVRNVMLCVVLLLLVLLCFLFPSLYTHVMAWKRRRDMKRSWSLNRRSFLRRSTSVRERNERGGYLRLY